jgi:hypothetical protein
MRFRHIITQGAVATLLIAGCGGDDSAEAPAPADASTADTGAEPTDDDGTSEPADTEPDEADGDESDDGQNTGDGGGTTDMSDIDWATVDLTTIDWANIDLDDIDLVAVQDNPTAGDLSDEDIAIIQQLNAARFGSGAATLTIADRTWEFDGFQCAFESSELLNEGTTLGTNLFGEVDGARIQMQIDVYDDGTAQFNMDDIDDFENPSVSYLETTDIAVTVEGNTVRAEGDVTDEASGSFEIVPMTFEGECGPDSAR